MYFGIMLAALGSLLIYHTWTTLLLACFSPFIMFRAAGKKALADGFGQTGTNIATACRVLSAYRTCRARLFWFSPPPAFHRRPVHLIAIFIGPPAYRLLGAGEDFAAWAEAGSLLPSLITFGLVVIFAIFGCYALSGAGILRRLPLLTPGLLGIASLYTLRGLALFVELGMVLAATIPLHELNIFYSTVHFAIGVIHFPGSRPTETAAPRRIDSASDFFD
jgi:hypothetical protein